MRKNSGFWLLFIAFIVLMAIILALAIGPYLLVSIGEKKGVPCSPAYLSECNNFFDCWLKTECGAGRGLICYPQCSSEGYKISCEQGKCVWKK